MRKLALFFSFFTVSCLLMHLKAAEPPQGPRFLPEVVLGGMPFRQIELALTKAEMRRGLMGRTYLAEDGGMLFFYGQPQIASFWMKNTRLPLDVLFLDEQGVVLQVSTMQVEPPRELAESEETYENRLKSYSCPRLVTSALEIKAGRAAELGLAPGTHIPELAVRAILQNIMDFSKSVATPE